ncbi:phosphodiester glycosidase family protein [Mucilaginibacter paludis]|uniref:Phosphodiester glycosidase domain-containing protein n=1 Tax=Mucilaginibacter paludis DSM 18603 TaxID=714943 RepID=H1Y6N7_9SPHI|nr:phosphodiester glycosidase family protein [Mucilaginibacter paludis]EHQ26829.1 hypothetical protein Mucpa_2717 [Mucilaginibacter paludis DSM 18603]
MAKYLQSILYSSAIVCLLLLSCAKDNSQVKLYPDPVVIVVDTTPLVKLPAYWVKATELMDGLPTGVQVYKTTAPFQNRPINAYCIVADPAKVEFKPLYSAANKTVSNFFKDEPGSKYACINGGFFGTGVSYSLCMYNGAVASQNIKSLNRSYQGNQVPYYPTRGAFGLSADHVAGVGWVYAVGINNILYSYPSPSPNSQDISPQPVPTATFPANGWVWNAVSAIGGSPVLIKDNTIRITDTEELIVIDNNSPRARSAIGFTSGNKIIVLAVEGGDTGGIVGLTLPELAALMKEMGCIGALNLDGGGSTSLVVNGKATVKPSDGAERGVMTAVMIKSK